MGRDPCLPSSSLPECSHGFTPKNEPGSVTDVITTSASQQTRVDFWYPTQRLGRKEAEKKIVGCDLHARQQSIAMVDTETGVLTEKVLKHEGNAVREFYAALEGRWCCPTGKR